MLANHRTVGYVEDLIASPALNYFNEINDDWQSHFQVSSALGKLQAVNASAGIGILHSYIAAVYEDLQIVLPQHTMTHAYRLSYHENLKGIRRIHEIIKYFTSH